MSDESSLPTKLIGTLLLSSVVGLLAGGFVGSALAQVTDDSEAVEIVAYGVGVIVGCGLFFVLAQAHVRKRRLR